MGRRMGGGGGGRGMGRGMGMGGGRGMGRGMGVPPAPLRTPQASEQVGGTDAAGIPSPPAGGSEIDVLKAAAQNLEAQLQAINARVAETGSGTDRRAGLVAVVAAEQCTGCGWCEKVCSSGAITIDTIAVIDAAKCTGCGQCVAKCPQEALTLKKT